MYSFFDYMPRMAEGGQPQEKGEDSYAGMAIGQLAALQDKAAKLREFLNPQSEIDPWVASKITLADDYLNTVADYLQYNPEGQGDQQSGQQGASEEPQEEPQMAYGGVYQMGGQPTESKDEAQQVIEAYSQMSGIKPDEIVQKLQQMKPEQQKKAYTEMKNTVVKAMQKQQSAQPQAQMGVAKHGGYISHDGSYRQAAGTGTNAGNLYYAYGGNIIPNYMKETSPMYNFGGYFPQGPRFEEGGKMPQWLAEARFKASGSEDKMAQYGYADGGQTMDNTMMGMINVFQQGGGITPASPLGNAQAQMYNTYNIFDHANSMFEAGGIVTGQILNNVDDEMLQKLTNGGYTYEIID